MIRTLILCLALALLAAAGSGCGQRTFTTDEFVEEANDEGAEIILGTELYSNDPDVSVHDVSFESGGAATVRVAADADAAKTAYASCSRQPEYLCFRASNVVVIVQGRPPGAEPLEQAIAAMASD
jgi:hypothetical protein